MNYKDTDQTVQMHRLIASLLFAYGINIFCHDVTQIICYCDVFLVMLYMYCNCLTGFGQDTQQLSLPDNYYVFSVIAMFSLMNNILPLASKV